MNADMLRRALLVPPPDGSAKKWAEASSAGQLRKFAVAAAALCADSISGAALSVWPRGETAMGNDQFCTFMAMYLGVPPPLIRDRVGEEVRAPNADGCVQYPRMCPCATKCWRRLFRPPFFEHGVGLYERSPLCLCNRRGSLY